MEKRELDKYLRKYKRNISNKRNDIICSLTTLSILLTSTACIIGADRATSKKKLYQTEKYTYNEYYNVVNHHYEFLDPMEEEHVLLIRKVEPWVKEKREAVRKVTVYRIDNMTFDMLRYKGNYKKAVENMAFDVIKEYKYKNELRDIDRYENAYFEVVDITQDKGKYIEETRPITTETAFMLLTEMVVYLFALKINEGPLTESILNDIRDINRYQEKINKIRKLKKRNDF